MTDSKFELLHFTSKCISEFLSLKILCIFKRIAPSTVFENHSKSLILQHCQEASHVYFQIKVFEVLLIFLTKINIRILAIFEIQKFKNEIFLVIFEHCAWCQDKQKKRNLNESKIIKGMCQSAKLLLIVGKFGNIVKKKLRNDNQ